VANLFDSANAPVGVPSEVFIGDFIQFKITEFSDDYANSAHTMKLIARISTGANTEITITASALDDDYLFSVASSSSASFTAGNYHYQLEITRDSDSNRIIVDRGHIKVSTDYDNNVDPRAHAEIMLSKIESILEGKADSDVSSYSIQGRSLTKLGIEELLEWRNYYRAEVNEIKRKEQIKHGRKTKSTVLGRF
tara:strand:- start:2177 stop:2758 length:582 start_codon:yes stop_codon:yes gene_type:complete